jgi:AcrR family transcriptional regulator
MNEIARRAEVGQGTLYRHFPDRAAIAAAIFDEQLDRIQSLADERRDDANRLVLVLEGLGDAFAQFHGLGQVLREVPSAHEERRLMDRFTSLMEGPIAEARSAGHLRADVTVTDMLLLCGMLDGALTKVDEPADRAATAQRVVTIVLNGLVRCP